MINIVSENYKEYYNEEEKCEIKIIKKGKNVNKVLYTIESSHFDNIMYSIKPSSKGLSSLAYYYYLCDGWYNESPWKINDNQSVFEQLKTINSSNLSEEDKKSLKDIIMVFRKATLLNEELYLVY